ncbi:MAG: hypothetical protein CVU84_15025 [Firmicutes bacterium HGW-Firmicutes-1]|jgi:uncharacterized protein YxjI|nr:MAG: hypothetical protein CVU84_15025 [Firmicutes bacterium HGW-Firmicutes-1]
MENQLSQEKYLIRRKVFTFAGAKFHVYDTNGQLVLFSKLKAFKLKEDIRLYTGEDMTTQLLNIQARKVIDFSGTYDVTDTITGDKVGALRRRGLKSMLKDEWVILDPNDVEIGKIMEDKMLLAVLRRLLTSLIPQSYDIFIGSTLVSEFKQNFNPFVIKLNLDFSKDNGQLFDKRLGLAAGILLCAIDGKQG